MTANQATGAGAIRLTRRGHACVRLDLPGTTVVIDPGEYSDADALTGADAVLITHEHVDHFDEGRLRAAAATNPALRIWTNQTVASQLEGLGQQVTVVGDGDTFDLGGTEVEVHGELHHVVHPDMPRMYNVGFFVGGTIFHPGDAFTVPPGPVDTLLVPVQGPWSATGDVIDYVRQVRPRLALAVHDGGLSAMGQAVVNHLLGATVASSTTQYVQLEQGTPTDIGPSVSV
jgi:L-ascorbate metabolism protein UlaG (beta-lactamase superfamily)